MLKNLMQLEFVFSAIGIYFPAAIDDRKCTAARVIQVIACCGFPFNHSYMSY